MENWGSEWQECEGWDGNAGNQRGMSVNLRGNTKNAGNQCSNAGNRGVPLGIAVDMT